MEESNWDVVVIGAGAAGLMVALRAAERGKRTLLLEKNRKPGVKILMSGGTRCNITHATDNRGIVDAFGKQGRFLHSALAALGVQQTIEFFENEGVATKVEETGKVFPVSDKALHVLEALVGRLRRSGAVLSLAEPVRDLNALDEGFEISTTVRQVRARRVVLTSGGKSYPGCGTTGDGYRLLSHFGHTIVPPVPALVPVRVAAPWVADLSGVTLAEVGLRVLQGDVMLAQRRGALLFAHFGLTGPAPLDVSRVIARHEQPRKLELVCDFLPGLPEPALDNLLRQASVEQGKKLLATVLPADVPRRLAEMLLRQADLPTDRKAAALSKSERGRLVQCVKQLRLPVDGTLGFEKAEVTAGGVELGEVDSRTMESKRCPGLYVAGEVLDLDGPIGGYNFQAAFSTGWLAGGSV